MDDFIPSLKQKKKGLSAVATISNQKNVICLSCAVFPLGILMKLPNEDEDEDEKRFLELPRTPSGS